MIKEVEEYSEESKNPKPYKRKKFDEPEICPVCKGEGTTESDLLDEPCPACEGEGVVWKY